MSGPGRTHVFSGSIYEELAGYARAVVVGDRIFVSGTVGVDFATGTMPESAEDQASQALDTIERALAEAGSELEDVVRVRVYVPDPSDVMGRIGGAEGPLRDRPARQHDGLRPARGARREGRDRGGRDSRIGVAAPQGSSGPRVRVRNTPDRPECGRHIRLFDAGRGRRGGAGVRRTPVHCARSDNSWR